MPSNEELQNQIAEQQRTIDRLVSLVEGMQNSNSITPEFQKVLERSVVSASGKSATSENQAVDEGGSLTYSVLKPPDGFVVIGDKHFAVWNN